MATQSLLWTALPNGFSADGRALKLSLLVSPRLRPESDPERLQSFRWDFEDWPGTLRRSSFTVRFGNSQVTIAGDDITGATRIDDSLGVADSAAWKALFPSGTFVRGFAFKDLSDNAVISYDAAAMEQLVRRLYRPLAAAAGDALPAPATFLGNDEWANVIATTSRVLDSKLRDPAERFQHFGSTGYANLKQGAERELALFQLFHTPPATAQTQTYSVPPTDAKSAAKWRTHARAEFPKKADFQNLIDFHQIVAAMNQYPVLLRRLGLVIDLLIERDALTAAANAELQVIVKLPALPNGATVKRTRDVALRTQTLLDSRRFQPVPRPNAQPQDYRVVDRLLDLQPKTFALLQSDVDGAGMKVLNFARSLEILRRNEPTQFHPVTKRERELGAPALRNAGLMLVHTGRGQMLKNTFARQKTLNDQVQAMHGGASIVAPAVFAEDVVRGYRIDIWDGKTRRWHSLCQRVATYDLNAGEVVINVTEEGTVRLAATKSADAASNQKMIWLHEALISWTGWSLSAPPPGRTINNQDTLADSEAELPPGLRLTSAFQVLPDTLPRLRYGREYWIRARVVDLAGNSLPPQPDDFGPEKPRDNVQPYLRYEPISPPVLALVKPTAAPKDVEAPAEGESMERMAVRTFNKTPAGNTVPSTQRARRFAVPSRTTQQEAEQHGMLDQAGRVDPAFFTMLSTKDNSLLQQVISMQGPFGDVAPVDTAFAALVVGEPLPYLPEPLAEVIVARIFDLPGHNPDTLINIPLYPNAAEWPDAVPFKIELYEKPAEKPRFDEESRTLLIPISKAVRATLRLSVRPTAKALSVLGIWHWLTPAQQSSVLKRARQGQHWMLTPWRDIELVHAVQKPLITPEMVKLKIDRARDATAAVPRFLTTCSIISTDHIDLRAAWSEPVDDLDETAGTDRPRTDHAFAVKITTEGEYAGPREYKLQAPDLIGIGLGSAAATFDRREKVHEFNDTRYRRIEYRLDATTKFREFMTHEVLTKEIDTTRVPTDDNIKVTGARVRSWVPSSAPPPAPDVLYVVPTFGWVRTTGADGRRSTWRRGGGLRVYLDRPWCVSGYGEMLAVVLPSSGFNGDPNDQPSAQPLKNFVTQWGNDPIWSSAFVPGVAPKQSHFPLARNAPNPSGKWLPTFAPPTEADQPPGQFKTTGLPHPELLISDGQAQVAIAPHDVFYDEERQLWYCDIEIDFGRAYYPFVRLAVARYQPVSVPGAHLSNIVLADFMQLVPDRWLTVSKTSQPRTHRVLVSGWTFEDSSSNNEAIIGLPHHTPDGQVIVPMSVDISGTSVLEVTVERLDPSWGEDFGWKPEPDARVEHGALFGAAKASGAKSVAKKTSTATTAAKMRARSQQLMQDRRFDLILQEDLLGSISITPRLWEGSVTLPASSGGARYRLAIAEYEEYLIDDDDPYLGRPTKKGRRLVFIEHVELT